jgi:hypothetical protein
LDQPDLLDLSHPPDLFQPRHIVNDTMTHGLDTRSQVI